MGEAKMNEALILIIEVKCSREGQSFIARKSNNWLSKEHSRSSP